MPSAWQRDGRAARLGIGSMVRVPLHGRRVGGWVVDLDTRPPDGVRLQPLAKLSGVGPPADVVELARWISHRWAGPLSAVLRSASPPTMTPGLPETSSTPSVRPSTDGRFAPSFGEPSSIVRIPPAGDLTELVAEACRLGDALIIAPSVSLARSLGSFLRRAGVQVALAPRDWGRAAVGATVVGARSAVLAPMPRLAAVVVIDEHDEALREERTPTWHAREVALQRAARAGVPCVLTSPVPSVEGVLGRPVRTPSRAEERAGWPVTEVIDSRRTDPGRSPLLSDRVTAVLRRPGRVACVLNRTGRARLLACRSCGELASCATCGAVVAENAEGRFDCRSCRATRPAICQSCGATRFRNLRMGVTRVRADLEALMREPVGEVTSAVDEPLDARVLIGTEAVLHRSTDVGTVIFLDFDQELLAPRFRAGAQALALLARAARLVGGRGGGGRIVVQTRQPRHPVVLAAVHADPTRFVDVDASRRELLGLPPYRALAAISGAVAADFVERLGQPLGIEVTGPHDGGWLVRAPDHDVLADALSAAGRPSGRLRIEVDPGRI